MSLVYQYPVSGLPLHCKVHDPQTWCNDIDEYVKRGDDAPELWAYLIANKDSAILLSFPVAPPLSWVTVELIASSKIEGTFEVWLKNPFKSFLCFLYETEGRWTLVTVLNNWLIGYCNVKELSCKDSIHRPQEQLAFEENMKTSEGRAQEYWCMFLHGKCTACQTESTSFDDLVPEKSERSGRGPF